MIDYETPLMEAILDILPTDEWITRSEIAKRLRGEKKLTSYDITLLDAGLVYQGKVDRQERSRGFTSYFVYRARGGNNGKTT